MLEGNELNVSDLKDFILHESCNGFTLGDQAQKGFLVDHNDTNYEVNLFMEFSRNITSLFFK